MMYRDPARVADCPEAHGVYVTDVPLQRIADESAIGECLLDLCEHHELRRIGQRSWFVGPKGAPLLMVTAPANLDVAWQVVTNESGRMRKRTIKTAHEFKKLCARNNIGPAEWR